MYVSEGEGLCRGVMGIGGVHGREGGGCSRSPNTPVTQSACHPTLTDNPVWTAVRGIYFRPVVRICLCLRVFV